MLDSILLPITVWKAVIDGLNLSIASGTTESWLSTIGEAAEGKAVCGGGVLPLACATARSTQGWEQDSGIGTAFSSLVTKEIGWLPVAHGT